MANQNKYSAKLNCEQKIDILRKNWLSHDARWQMAIVKKLGWEKGNKINKAIIKDMGKVMMQRLLNVIGVKKITNINDYIEICYTAMELYYPYPSMKYTFKKISENEISGIIEKCIIYDQVKKMKVDNFYECGCFSMRAGWYKALGFKAEEKCLKCLKNGDDNCIINSKVLKWNS